MIRTRVATFVCIFPVHEKYKKTTQQDPWVTLWNNHLCFLPFAQYPYRDCDVSKILLHLIHITVNTLNAQYHSCKPHATAGPLYSDNSNISRYSEKEKGTSQDRILS